MSLLPSDQNHYDHQKDPCNIHTMGLRLCRVRRYRFGEDAQRHQSFFVAFRFFRLAFETFTISSLGSSEPTHPASRLKPPNPNIHSSKRSLSHEASKGFCGSHRSTSWKWLPRVRWLRHCRRLQDGAPMKAQPKGLVDVECGPKGPCSYMVYT